MHLERTRQVLARCGRSAHWWCAETTSTTWTNSCAVPDDWARVRTWWMADRLPRQTVMTPNMHSTELTTIHYIDESLTHKPSIGRQLHRYSALHTRHDWLTRVGSRGPITNTVKHDITCRFSLFSKWIWMMLSQAPTRLKTGSVKSILINTMADPGF